MIRKRNPSKDRFRAGRRIAEKAAREARGGQLLFPWYADYAATIEKAPAPGSSRRATA
jgi:hypothetical protein